MIPNSSKPHKWQQSARDKLSPLVFQNGSTSRWTSLLRRLHPSNNSKWIAKQRNQMQKTWYTLKAWFRSKSVPALCFWRNCYGKGGKKAFLCWKFQPYSFVVILYLGEWAWHCIANTVLLFCPFGLCRFPVWRGCSKPATDFARGIIVHWSLKKRAGSRDWRMSVWHPVLCFSFI